MIREKHEYFIDMVDCVKLATDSTAHQLSVTVTLTLESLKQFT